MTPPPRDAGLTLLELTVTMAVFALIAVMGLQALSGSVRVQEVLGRRHAETWEAAEALALLRRDLERVTDRAFVPPQQAPEPAVVFGGDSLHLSVAGMPTLPGTTETGEMRVVWRFDATEEVLYRQAWLSLTPFNTRAQGPEVAILSGITELVARGLTPDGWSDRFGSADVPTARPRAIEVTLTTSRHGDLRVMVTP